MIREICNLLKSRLEFQGGLPFVDVYAGLAQTVTYNEVDENGNPLVKKMPVSYDTNIEDCTVSPEKAVVPDSGKMGIIYFEDNGGAAKYRRLAGGWNIWRANVILVCWLNRRKITGDDYSQITLKAFTDIIAKLKENDLVDPFRSVTVYGARFRQDATLFTKYSYKEEELQYLRPPFEHFAIDLQVSFMIKGDCLPQIVLNPNNC